MVTFRSSLVWSRAGALIVALTMAWTIACGDGESNGREEDVGQGDTVDDATTDLSTDGDVDDESDVGLQCHEYVCDDGTCSDACNPAPVFLHDPTSGYLTTFPDDFFTEADENAATGLAVRLDAETVPHLGEAAPEDLGLIFEDLSRLDGFGTSAGVIFRFTRPLDRESVGFGEETADDDSPIIFGYLADDGFVRLPVEPTFVDDDTTIILWPMVPMPPETRAVVGLTRTTTGADSVPIEPNWVLSSLLDGSADAPMDRMAPRVQEAVAALVDAGTIDSGEDLAALTVFTTQSVFDESVAVAADIRSRTHTVKERLGCTNEAAYRLCQVVVEAGHYRNEEGAYDPTESGGPRSVYDLTVNVYIPHAAGDLGGPPYPTILFAHGMAGTRSQAVHIARHAAPAGLVTVSIDAPEHGAHPLRSSEGAPPGILEFFGVSVTASVNPTILRDNFRQATWDKLAVVQLLLDGLDADGDGHNEVDPERLSYYGTSLGGVMGPELLTLAPELEAAIVSISGGRLTDVMRFGDNFTLIIELFRPPSATDGDLARFWVYAQTALERGDAVNYAPLLFNGRLDGGAPTQILMPTVIDDDIIPEEASFTLARALGVAHVPPVIREVGLIDVTQPPPISDNLPGGGTAGFLQYEWLWQNGGWERAIHGDLVASEVAKEAWLHFLTTFFETGVAEIIDPYEAMGLERPE